MASTTTTGPTYRPSNVSGDDTDVEVTAPDELGLTAPTLAPASNTDREYALDRLLLFATCNIQSPS